MGIEGVGEWVIIIVFYVLLLLIFFGIISVIKASVKIVHHAEVMVLERFGKYKTTLKPGLHFLIPYVDVPRQISWRYVAAPANGGAPVIHTLETDRIDMREHVLDFGSQHVITKDTVSIDIDALLYFRITDASLCIMSIQNLPVALELLTQATLRNIIANMNLDDTFSSREEISAELREKTMADAERWGVTIVRVEVMNILPPYDIKQAMEMQIKAERDRRSTVLRADGERESAIVRSRGDAAKTILNSEGRKTSRVQVAKGEAEAKLLTATAEAQAVKLLQEQIKEPSKKAVDYLVAMQMLNSMRHISYGSSTPEVVLLPSRVVADIKEVARFNVVANSR